MSEYRKTEADVGDKIELISSGDKSLESGMRGKVESIDVVPPEVTKPNEKGFAQLWVEWDNGSRLALLEGKDKYKIVDDEEDDYYLLTLEDEFCETVAREKFTPIELDILLTEINDGTKARDKLRKVLQEHNE